ncbi:hypothetical protein OA412_01745 [Candidatus Pelagibacter sp.]|nr:hypothetical protein [Candidatus Pelagibacter sp.]|tara:strand:- start:159 stop:404 length:246 start_codon:yes stop_codon:yes gene_type:complete
MPKKKTNKSEEIFISKISKILSITKNELLKKDDFSKIEGYDSLKHLEIITQIDKIYGKKIKKIGDLSKLTSVKKIIKQLNK